MATIKDFDAWLEEANPDDFEEIYALYCTVKDEESSAWYQCSRSKDKQRFFIKGSNTEDTLMLLSDKAKASFLSLIVSRYCDRDNDMEMWYDFKRSMAKDD